MKLHVLQDECFSCHSCTNCCRDWHVELLAGEAERIQSLNWPASNPAPAPPASLFTQFNGNTYLAHTKAGVCIFLNESTSRCRIHEQFGSKTKPLGCQLFPFQVMPTFEGHASISPRFFCPTVRQNQGQTHEAQLPELRALVDDMRLPFGFDEVTRCLLDYEQVEAVCDFISMLMGAFQHDQEKALFILIVADWLATTKVLQLNAAYLGEAFADLKERTEVAFTAAQDGPEWGHRLAFRTLLSLYLRRDEDVLNGRASRFGRSLAMTQVVLGFGSFQGLGLSHKPGSLRKAKVFSVQKPADPDAFALHWRMIRTKLRSFHFMGRANHGRDFLTGLRSLALLYPLVVAVARYSAANRNSPLIQAPDVEYAVASIEHSYGRLPILNQPLARSLEKLLLQTPNFARLVRGV